MVCNSQKVERYGWKFLRLELCVDGDGRTNSLWFKEWKRQKFISQPIVKMLTAVACGLLRIITEVQKSGLNMDLLNMILAI